MGGAGGPICGIDLGTTFSSIAFLNAFGRAEVIATPDGSRSIPSVILFPPGGGPPLVGRAAKERSAEHPERTVEFVKREMGDPDWRFTVDGEALTPPALSSLILRALVDLAASRLGERPRAAVITCPAYFGDLERQATADAGALAGLEVLGTFNEPTAAALAFGLHQAARTERVRALVYDLGGGTFDVTVLELERRAVRVLATAGEHRLGGKDWDDELVNHVAEAFLARFGKDPREDPGAQQDLRNRCEAAKVSLSTRERAVVFCRAYGETLKLEVTRERFDELTRPLLLQTKTYVDQVLAAAGVGWPDIHAVLPVGGCSYMPQVRRLLTEAAGRPPEDVIDPELAVVQGATYYAALLRAQQGFSIEVLAARPRGAPTALVDEELPALPPAGGALDEGPEVLSLPGQVGPAPAPVGPVFAEPRAASAEAPADPSVREWADLVGGALEAAGGALVRDVNARSLGLLVQAQGAQRTRVMIRRNTPLPAIHRSTFFTVKDGQTAVKVVVLEGESEDASQCARVGEVVITGLPARPRGQEIEIIYTYDVDGRLAVLARDLRSGQTAAVELRRATGMGTLEREAQRRVLDGLRG